MTNAVSPPIQALLDLFHASLADVRFADLDAASLARLAADVEAAAEAVAVAQATLDSTRSALQERQDALLENAQRALAYARVYVESRDELLAAQLEAVTLPRTGRQYRDETLTLSVERTAAPRPRGRPRKVPSLPLEGPVEVLAIAAHE